MSNLFLTIPPNEAEGDTLSLLGTDGQPVETQLQNGGSGPTTVTPLSRTIYVDGGYTGGSSNGSIAAPYTTISAALATIPQPTSPTDAESLWLVLVAPVLGGYASEPANTITIPAYRNIWIQGLPGHMGAALFAGASTTANLVWANTAAQGGTHPPTFALLQIESFVCGNITVTDDNTVQSAVQVFGESSCGNVVGTGAAKLSYVQVDSESFVLNINTPSAGCSLSNGGECVEVTCTYLDMGVNSVAGPDANPTGLTTISGGASLVDSFNGVNANFVDAYHVNVVSVLTGNLVAQQSVFSGESLTCVDATIRNCSFSEGFQLHAASVTTDAQSWQSYLGQGGLPNGATVTIVGQAATAYAPNPGITQSLAITPGTAGAPLVAFNLTCTQTGLLDIAGSFLRTCGTADQPAYSLLLYTGTSTGGVAAASGRNALVGSDANPITVPGGTPTLIAGFGQEPAQNTTEVAEDFPAVAVAPVGTAVSVVLVAAGAAANVWTTQVNGRVFERALN